MDIEKLFCVFLLIFVVNMVLSVAIQIFISYDLASSSMFFALFVGTILGFLASFFTFVDL